jgi:hypothetical protein
VSFSHPVGHPDISVANTSGGHPMTNSIMIIGAGPGIGQAVAEDLGGKAGMSCSPRAMPIVWPVC